MIMVAAAANTHRKNNLKQEKATNGQRQQQQPRCSSCCCWPACLLQPWPQPSSLTPSVLQSQVNCRHYCISAAAAASLTTASSLTADMLLLLLLLPSLEELSAAAVRLLLLPFEACCCHRRRSSSSSSVGAAIVEFIHLSPLPHTEQFHIKEVLCGRTDKSLCDQKPVVSSELKPFPVSEVCMEAVLSGERFGGDTLKRNIRATVQQEGKKTTGSPHSMEKSSQQQQKQLNRSFHLSLHHPRSFWSFVTCVLSILVRFVLYSNFY